MQIYLVLGKKGPALDLLADVCKAVPYGCADFPVNPTYHTLRGDPRFTALEKKYDATSQLSASTSSAP